MKERLEKLNEALRNKDRGKLCDILEETLGLAQGYATMAKQYIDNPASVKDALKYAKLTEEILISLREHFDTEKEKYSE